MPKHVKSYEVFISSPSDVALERDTIHEAIEETSQFLEMKDGIRLKPIRWEADVSSEIGDAPQKVINKQIGDEYDIFIGVLCNRFGKPTDNFLSGTEEEFERAFERRQTCKENLEILFYFKDPRKSEAPIDARQYLKVTEFKERIANLGVYSEFDSHDKLKTLVISALMKAVERLEKNVSGKPGRDADSKKTDLMSLNEQTALLPISEFDQDIGLIELTEIIFEGAEACTDVMQIITNATERLGSRIGDRSQELRGLQLSGNVVRDNKVKKPIIDKAASEMQRYAQVLEQNTPEAKRALSQSLLAMQHAVLISQQDGLSSAEENAALSEQLYMMQKTFSEVHDQVSEFYQSISTTPRMTSKLNQAKRRTIKAIQGFLDFITETNGSVETTLRAIDS